MGFFDRLFNKQEPVTVSPEIDKAQVTVYPMIKSADWKGIDFVQSTPFVAINGQQQLAVVFAQDAGNQFEYLTPADLEKPGVAENYQKWQSNIDAYPYQLELVEAIDKRVATASGQDHSAEKILSPAFLTEACKALNTDKLIISAPRRRWLMLTSYHEEFELLEEFFRLHFVAWRNESYGDELITEMVYIADNRKVTHAVPLGFRLNLYEKDGQEKLSYSTMDDLFDENNQINFQKIMDKNKIAVSL